jgi:hypothetical protein
MVSLVWDLQVLVVGGRVDTINFLSVPPGAGGNELSIGIVPSTLVISGVDYCLLLYEIYARSEYNLTHKD